MHYPVTTVVMIPVFLLSLCQEQGRNKLTIKEQFLLNLSNLALLSNQLLIIKSIIALVILGKIESVHDVQFTSQKYAFVATLIMSSIHFILTTAANLLFYHNFQTNWE